MVGNRHQAATTGLNFPPADFNHTDTRPRLLWGAVAVPRNITQKYGYHCWWRTCLGPFLAKTSRTAVLTAIMDLSAGGRLYKCLYKMHVASRAFWGAFWGAFRVFLRDVG